MWPLVALMPLYLLLEGGQAPPASPAPRARGAAPSRPASPSPDPWAAVRFLEGEWTGESEGQAGNGRVERTYQFVIGGHYLYERNISTYAPQPRNEAGEVHEHWSFLSWDRARRALVLRQFHQEGFVNQYLQSGASLVFESEGLENSPPGWRARETYDVVSPEEFVETFELAPAGGPFEIYVRTRFKRRH